MSMNPFDYHSPKSLPEAIAYLESVTEPLSVSAVSVAELYAGVREGAERAALEQFLAAFEIIPVDRAIAVAGGLYRRDYGKSHATGLADALIAATRPRSRRPEHQTSDYARRRPVYP